MDEKIAAFTGSLGSLGSQAGMRERYWEELTDAEKIERLREELGIACCRLGEAANTIRTLMAHHHSASGVVMVEAFPHSIGYPDGAIRDHVPHRLRTERERR